MELFWGTPVHANEFSNSRKARLQCFLELFHTRPRMRKKQTAHAENSRRWGFYQVGPLCHASYAHEKCVQASLNAVEQIFMKLFLNTKPKDVQTDRFASWDDFSCRECLLNSENLNGGMSGLTEQKIQAIIANMWREKVVCLGQQWCPCRHCGLPRGPSRNLQETPMKDGKAKWIRRDIYKEASACPAINVWMEKWFAQIY